jgi:hypothetical protein
MSDSNEYRNIVGVSYGIVDVNCFPKLFLLISINRESGFFDVNELITLYELISVCNGEDGAIYYHGKCSSDGKGWKDCSSGVLGNRPIMLHSQSILF